MNGPHDLGGKSGFGPVLPEENEPYFHAEWEKKALALTLCAGGMGHWSIDESRHARECLHPADYYGSSYYEIWTKALENLLVTHGFVTRAELAAGHSISPGTPPKRVLQAEQVPATLARGGPADRKIDAAPRFKAGDRVQTIVAHPEGHTRLPLYARGKVGTIEIVVGSHVFPDTNAHGEGEQPNWLYTVSFSGDELWGRDGDPDLTISIDAWEPYLEHA